MTDVALIRKKLLWQATHRGTQELDILLGNFARKFLDSLNEASLRSLEEFMNLDEPQLERMMRAEQALPTDLDSALYSALEQYIREYSSS